MTFAVLLAELSIENFFIWCVLWTFANFCSGHSPALLPRPFLLPQGDSVCIMIRIPARQRARGC